jgi:hypothetical protein
MFCRTVKKILEWGVVKSNRVHSALRSSIGLLYHPRVIVMEKFVEWQLARETEILGENLSQCHIIFLVCAVGLWVLRPSLAYCTSPG